MENNDDTISDSAVDIEKEDPELEETEIDEPKKVRESMLILDVFRSELRTIILGIIIFLLLSMDALVTPEVTTVVMSFFIVMIPNALLFMVSGTIVVGLLVFLNNRIDLSYDKRQGLNKIVSHIDLIVSCVLASVSLFLLPNVLDWGSRVSAEAYLGITNPAPGPGYGIYVLQMTFGIISRFILFGLVVNISFVFLYGAIFYRFATRILRFLDTENRFTLTYIGRSGKSYLYAIGLIMGYTFVVMDSISSDLLVVYLMMFALPFALCQRSLAKTSLEKYGKNSSKIMTTPIDRLTKWYSFATKRSYRWLIFVGIFISLNTVFNLLLYLSLNQLFAQWEFISLSCIALVAYSTLYIITRYIAVIRFNQGSAIGKRKRVESALDLVVSAMVTVVAAAAFLTEIGPAKWMELVMLLQNHYSYSYTPYAMQHILNIATLWQLWMILMLLAMIIRLFAVGRAFADRYYEKERSNSKLLARSGKILIIAIASLLSAKWAFSGILYFGFISDVQVFLLLTIIILQTVLSQIRMREIKLMEEIVN